MENRTKINQNRASRGPRGASLVLPGLGTLGSTAARRPRVTPHHSDVVHTAYLHIPGGGGMRTLRML